MAALMLATSLLSCLLAPTSTVPLRQQLDQQLRDPLVFRHKEKRCMSMGTSMLPKSLASTRVKVQTGTFGTSHQEDKVGRPHCPEMITTFATT
uniref:Secreted protein n=1 Tax=Oryza nivara TaxID=4536 RepID=A0A0E0FLL7_ORYNI